MANIKITTSGLIYKQVRGRWVVTRGSCSGTGHLHTRLWGKNILIHRLVWEAFNGTIPPGQLIDHIDRNPSNNSLKNLRLATKQLNAANANIIASASRFKGVARHRHRWRAYITAGDLSVHLGLFNTEIGAARAYDETAREWFGAYAALNFKE